MQVRPMITGEYQDYKSKIISRVNKQSDSDTFQVTDNITLDSWYGGSCGAYHEILTGSHVDNNPHTPDEITKRYVFSTDKGLIKDVEIKYVEQNESGREVITKQSTDILNREVLSMEKVDASTGEVLEEWFVPDHKHKI